MTGRSTWMSRPFEGAGRRSRRLTPWLLLAPILVGVTVFFLIPFGITLYDSVTFGVTGRFVGLENYIQVWNSSTFRLAMGNTLRFLLLGVPLIMVLSFALALLAQKRFTGTRLFRSALLLPMAVGVASIVTATEALFSETGMLNRILEALGIPAVAWLDGPAAFWVLLGLYLWKNFGYNVVLYLAGLNAIPRAYYDDAELSGASAWQKLRAVTLPMMTPTFFFVFVISVMNCFRTYREAFLLAGEHPQSDIYMLQHYLSNNFKNLNYQRLSVASVCLFLLVSVLVAIFYRFQRRYEGAMQ